MRNAEPYDPQDFNSDNEPQVEEAHSQMKNDENDPTLSHHVKQSASRASKILDASYKKADVPEIINNLNHLNNKGKNKLEKLLTKFEYLFHGTLGNFDWEPAELNFKPGEDKPYHANRAFAVPQIHHETLKT